MHAVTSHWLPRIADALIEAMTDLDQARTIGDARAVAEHEEDIARFAKLAWTAIKRAGKPRPIATPRRRDTPRSNDIHIHHGRLSDHRAYPYTPAPRDR